jgi:hypothetical protein
VKGPDVQDPTSAELRRRASALRQIARIIDGSSLHQLAARSGDDTWQGPTALAFRQELHQAQRTLDNAMHELVAGASRLEHEAHEIDLNVALS